jgi:hypothetical protein
VFLKIGNPILISLDIPFDDIEFEKTQGWMRMAMDEEEEKTFYKAVRKNIEVELMKNKELMKTAEIHNREVIMEIMKLMPEVKSVIFE